MADGATTRLGLSYPVAGSGELVNSVQDLEDNWKKVDAQIGAFNCTSGTRPATPWIGQNIYETDTQRELVCIGTGPTVWQVKANGTKTVLGSSVDSGTGVSTIIPGGGTNIVALTSVAVPNNERRLLKARAHGYMRLPVASNIAGTIALRWGALFIDSFRIHNLAQNLNWHPFYLYGEATFTGTGAAEIPNLRVDNDPASGGNVEVRNTLTEFWY